MENLIKEILDSKLKHLKKNPLDVTKLVFIEIKQNYLARYYRLANMTEQNSFKQNMLNRNNLNRKIGKYIKLYWRLNNLNRCETNLYVTFNKKNIKLISSYRKHSN
jgi:hypothetical protein